MNPCPWVLPLKAAFAFGVFAIAATEAVPLHGPAQWTLVAGATALGTMLAVVAEREEM